MIYFFNNSFIQDRDEIQRISQKHEKLRNDIVKIKSNIPSLIEKLERNARLLRRMGNACQIIPTYW